MQQNEDERYNASDDAKHGGQDEAQMMEREPLPEGCLLRHCATVSPSSTTRNSSPAPAIEMRLIRPTGPDVPASSPKSISVVLQVGILRASSQPTRACEVCCSGSKQQERRR